MTVANYDRLPPATMPPVAFRHLARALAVSVAMAAMIGPAAALVKEAPGHPEGAVPATAGEPLAQLATGRRGLPGVALVEVPPTDARLALVRARIGGDWRARAERATGRIVLLWGSGPVLGQGGGPVSGLLPGVRALLGRLRELHGVADREMELAVDRSIVLDEGAHVFVDFDRVVGGVPVRGSRLYVRLSAGHVVQIGFDRCFPIDPAAAVPAVAAAAARERAFAWIGGRAPGDAVVREPRLVLLPEGEDGVRLVWEVTLRRAGSDGTWLARLDAGSGETVAFFDANRYVSGTVLGDVHARTVTDPEQARPFRLQRVAVGSGSTTTLLDGSWSSTRTGDVTFTLDGLAPPGGFRVVNQAGPNASVTVPNPGPTVDHVWSAANARGDERNAFYHLHQARGEAQKWILPGWFSSVVTANVGLPGVCNAYWDGTTVNFFPEAGGCANSGEIADIVMHEWGHGLDENFGGIFDDAGSEGLGDVVAWLVTRSPLLAPAFYDPYSPPLLGALDDHTAIRDASKPVTAANLAERCQPAGSGCGGPLGHECHCEGLVLSGAMWDLGRLLVARHGEAVAWPLLARLAFQTVPTWLDHTQVMDALLAADDDNGSLLDGTPNACLIHQAFEGHGTAGAFAPCSTPLVRLALAASRIDDAVFGDGDGVAEPGETVALELTVENLGNAAGSAVTAVVATTAPGVTVLSAQAAFPAVAAGGRATSLAPHVQIEVGPTVACGSEVPLTVTFSDGASRWSGEFAVRIGRPAATLYRQDFESGAGGFTGNTGSALTGQWIQGLPRLTAQDGDVWQPGTCGEGQGCLFTGQNASWDAVGGDDVDRGTAIAESGAFDLSGAVRPVLEFRYWFASSAVAVQVDDVFEVEIASGASAVRVFTERVSRSAWRFAAVPLAGRIGFGPGMRLRFRATDDAQATNVVEAAIDDVRIVEYECSAPACSLAGAIVPAGPLALCEGEGARLSASVSGCPGPLAWQWRLDGGDVPGANAPDFDLPASLAVGAHTVEARATCGAIAGCAITLGPVAVEVRGAAAPAVVAGSLRAGKAGSDVEVRWESTGSGSFNLHRTADPLELGALWQTPPYDAAPASPWSDPGAVAAGPPLLFYQVFGADCRGVSQP